MSIDADIRAILEGARKTVAPEVKTEPVVEERDDEEDNDDVEGITEEEQIVEDILALDELSKKTLGSYVNKAANSAAMAWGKHKTAEAGAEEVSRFTNRHMNDKFKNHDKIKDMIGASTKEIEKHRETTIKRIHGISQATKRLTKEQKETIESILEELEDDQIVEDILALDELSKKTLGSYVSKALKRSRSDLADTVSAKEKGEPSNGKYSKRIKGIVSASNRLTKEQKETIESILEELSQEERTIKVDVSEDVNALLNGEDLTEEFKTKAATIFEAAVVTRVKDEVSKLEEAYETKLEEAVESIKEGLAEKVDGYLSYIVEKWIEDNEIALTNGVKLEVMESFVSGIKNVFEQNYIEVPEEKFDVLASMEEKMADLESKLNESIEKNVALHTEIGSLKRESTISEAADGLTDTQVEKFKKLAEELSFEDEESFNKKLKTIRENYFTTKSSTNKQLTETFITDEPINEEVKPVKLDPKMSAYASAIK